MSTRTVAINTSAPREGLVKMPSYTIQEDPPWMQKPRNRMSAAPSSVYSSGSDVALGESEVSPQSMKQPSYTATCYAHDRQQITDSGPQSKRQSRLPIFKQVRTMLSNKPGGTTKWDEMSGEPSETGKPAHSNYVSPWEGAFQARRRSPERRNTTRKKNHSPVSILRDDERNAGPSRTAGSNSRSISPVSTLHSLAPSQISVNSVATLPPALNVRKQVKRKPVRGSLSPSASENFPPSDLRSVGSNESIGRQPDSRFSWSTIAPSLAGNREPTDNANTRAGKSGSNSRFSWSTIATNTTYTHHEEAEPPSPPPAIPSKFLQPLRQESPQPPSTMHSILSRKRPVQPRDRESPPASEPIRMYAPTSPTVSHATTPTNRSASLRAPTASSPPKPFPANKALPLPPFMTSEQASHLENLISQQNNILLQRRNIEKMIAEYEQKEKASPMEVSFSEVRDARKKLAEQSVILDEVKREEMEFGIKIARARRKEDFGEGEGTLWVRRVTG